LTIEKLDFVTVPSTNVERSRTFYLETLGLRPDERNQDEFWVGETCFGIYEPAQYGIEFQPQTTAPFALHVDDVEAAREDSSRREWSSPARRSTRACATWRSSGIPTATS
jgi:catechol 2,3-dioxygenase-like lactoylglutathione lyase family enzyme